MYNHERDNKLGTSYKTAITTNTLGNCINGLLADQEKVRSRNILNFSHKRYEKILRNVTIIII